MNAWHAYRVPMLCVLVSLALHWVILSALVPVPTEFRLSMPSLELAWVDGGAPRTHVAATESIAGAATDAPRDGASVPARATDSASMRPGSPAELPTGAARSPVERARDTPKPAVLPVPTRPSQASRGPAVDGRSRESSVTRTAPGHTESSISSQAAPQPADDRGIQTPDQYRLALLFEARRMQSASGVGRATTDRNGRSRVRLEFGAGGVLSALQVIESSGTSELDDEAMRLLTRAQARLPVPALLLPRAFHVDATVSFEAR